MDTATHFFHDHAGYSYNPEAETPEQGRSRTAAELAEAEQQATANGYSFRWQHDPDATSEDFQDTDAPYSLWLCTMYDDTGRMVGNLGGIDLGPDGDPWSDPYRRVVEAELAHENITS